MQFALDAILHTGFVKVTSSTINQITFTISVSTSYLQLQGCNMLATFFYPLAKQFKELLKDSRTTIFILFLLAI